MSRWWIGVKTDVHAPARDVYETIADYRRGHPRIVPPKYFRNLVVEEGGYGAGTRIRYDMTVLGKTRTSRAVVEEPQPGRVLVERNLDYDAVTTFEVEPVGDVACLVSIGTEMPRKPGLAGAFEKFLVSRIFPRIYREELLRLEDVAKNLRRSDPSARA
jgi:hypothetical protein